MLLQEAELQSEKKSSFIHEFERFDKGQWNATVFWLNMNWIKAENIIIIWYRVFNSTFQH